MKPTKVEFYVGDTFHKQRVVLEISNTQGREEISITKHAMSQRDDTERIFGLSRQNILLMAEAIQTKGV